MMDVSITIPTFNKAHYLDFTLAAFTIQNHKNFELIIIDDGSTDNTCEVVKKYQAMLDIHYEYQNHKGLANARNLALDLSTGRYIIHIDDDRIPSPNFVLEHITTLNKYPKTVSIGSKQVILTIYSDQLPSPYSRFVELMRRNPSIVEKIKDNTVQFFAPELLMDSFDKVIEDYYFYEPLNNNKEVIQKYSDSLSGFHLGWGIATTGNMGFDRQYMGEVNFDENYKGWGIEDTDFSYQLHLQGYKFRFTRGAINYHQEHPRGINQRQELSNNIAYFCSKFPSLEVYLFTRIFELKEGFWLIEANELIDIFLSMRPNKLTDDYRYLCKLRVEEIFGSDKR